MSIYGFLRCPEESERWSPHSQVLSIPGDGVGAAHAASAAGVVALPNQAVRHLREVSGGVNNGEVAGSGLGHCLRGFLGFCVDLVHTSGGGD